MTTKGELLPCPICGNKPIMTKITTTYLPEKEDISIDITEVYIFCAKCGLKTNSVLTENTLIADWNTRSQILTDEEMERLEKE